MGLWLVVGAKHTTTNKDVSVWIFDKRVLDGIKGDSAGRSAATAREWVVEQLKKEVRGTRPCCRFVGCGSRTRGGMDMKGVHR